MTIRVDGVEWSMEQAEAKAVSVEMWYNRHLKLWEVYPVDAEGNQLDGSRYAYGKDNAEKVKAEVERDVLTIED